MQPSEYDSDINSVRAQASEGGLKFEAYIPPRLAEWVISLVEKNIFRSPSEAAFVALQCFQELEENPDINSESTP